MPYNGCEGRASRQGQVPESSPMNITASAVAERSRMSFLPSCFGVAHMVRGEALVYGSLRRLSSSYTGGSWVYFELSNGGFYMAPAGQDAMRIEAENGFDGDLSTDAAGIVAMLYAFGHLAFDLEGSEAGDRFSELYHALRDFALCHTEAAAIAQAID